MTITIPDIPFDWTAILITSGIAVALLVLSILMTILWDSGAIVVPWVFTVVMCIIGIPTFGVLPATSAHSFAIQDAKEAALSEEGFEKVMLRTDDTFTASLDGAYFEGVLVPLNKDETEFQVNELIEYVR